MDTPPVIAPLIHLNGDRAETLQEALEHAYMALDAAMDAVQDTAPNGRNYYPQAGLFAQARAQYERRMQTLNAMKESLMAECIAIDAQREAHTQHTRSPHP